MVPGQLLAGAAGAALAGWLAPVGIGYSPLAGTLGIVRGLGEQATRDGLVGLTFDDGPQAGVTDRYLDLLGERGLVATFFVVGREAERCPALVERMVREGHDVQCHGQRHRDHLLRTPRGVVRDIGRGADTIAAITGARPTLYRPPQGVVTPATLVGARRAGLPLVLWSQWARDWRRRATAATIAKEAGRVQAGGILLLHDADHYSQRSWHATWEALPAILDGLTARGLEPTSLQRAGVGNRIVPSTVRA